MVKVDIRSNVGNAVARLGIEHGKISQKAQVRALNRTVDQLRTQAGREIRQTYNVTLRGVRQASKIIYARAGTRFPFSELSFSGRAINLVEFDARAVNPWNIKGRSHRKDGGGVSVRILVKGGRKLAAGAFLATIKTGQNAGKQGVFRRKDRTRESIRFLPSISLPVMAERKAIAGALIKFANEKFNLNFAHELNFLLTSK